MKRYIVLLLVAALVVCLLAGCNMQILDTTYAFSYAYIILPNGECVEGKVVSWADFENGDEVQLRMEDGNTYLTHYSRVVMVAK